jgi:LPXTG-site transpeptidase (sortase) family protein
MRIPAGPQLSVYELKDDLLKLCLCEFTSLHETIDYIVGSTEVVEPDDTRVIESRGVPELTLISCYPFYFVGAAPAVHCVRHSTASVLLATR